MARPTVNPHVNIVKGISVLLACQLAGEASMTILREFFPFLAFPGPVVGMALLFGWIFWRRCADPDVEASGLGLLRNLSLLFVPATVGFVQHGAILAQYGLIILTALVASAAITLAVTALTFQVVAKWQGIGDDDEL